MTLTSEIITDAFRQSNLIASSGAPTSAETTEALRHLNRLVKSVFGNEVGENLNALPFGDANISRPDGYPELAAVAGINWFVPSDSRLVLNLTEAKTVYLSPAPQDGARFAILDSAENLSTFPITIVGNGRRIEGALDLTVNTDGADSEWFYRGDLGNWQKYSPLVEADTFPFPEEFDDFFITMLGVRLNPSYGVTIDGQSEVMLKRAEKHIRSRYSQSVQVGSEAGLLRLPSRYYSFGGYYNSTLAFNRGWP